METIDFNEVIRDNIEVVGGLLPLLYMYRYNGNCKATIGGDSMDYPKIIFRSSGYSGVADAIISEGVAIKKYNGTPSAISIFYKKNRDGTITEYFKANGGFITVFSNFPLEPYDSIPEDATEIKE